MGVRQLHQSNHQQKDFDENSSTNVDHYSMQDFNTVFVSALTNGSEQAFSELEHIFEKPAYQFLIKAVQEYAQEQDMSFESAAHDLIGTFQELDQLWRKCLYQQALKNLKDSFSS